MTVVVVVVVLVAFGCVLVFFGARADARDETEQRRSHARLMRELRGHDQTDTAP